MQANIGKIDRIIRIVVGLLLLSLVFIGPQTLWGLVGLVPLATAFINFCPAYKFIGVDTLGK
ncbi:MAG: YgaP family membrane protein [Methylocystis sp.]